MRVRSLCVAVLIGLTFVLTPMALASPPDESWPAGLWDDGDFDDVVLFLTGCCPAIAAPLTPDVVPVGLTLISVSHRDDGPIPALSFSLRDSRAPPAS